MGNGLIYLLAVNLVIWAGIVYFLFKLERKISRLEKEIEQDR